MTCANKSRIIFCLPRAEERRAHGNRAERATSSDQYRAGIGNRGEQGARKATSRGQGSANEAITVASANFRGELHAKFAGSANS